MKVTYYIRLSICTAVLTLIASCGKNNVTNKTVEENSSLSTAIHSALTKETSQDKKGNKKMDYKAIFDNIRLAKSYKGLNDTNPIFTQHFGADPYAMVYNGQVYFYMTADAFEHNADKSIKDNTYGNIRSLYVVSTSDMVNFTDHGEIKVAGNSGAAKWAHNSWAPAATWKKVNGKPKFFLYFADNGGGIGVLTSDSPTGPFNDELGHALITRDTPNCNDVLWLFDPAVLMDTDGSAYIYFGGGVPEGKESNPGTARCAKLGNDMMSLAADPVKIDAPYIFEDSGIHKYKDKYYYTYCSNFNVDKKGTEKYGFESGEIISLQSKSPLGPFKYKERILKNPGAYWGLGGNNHHCVFEFDNHWYIAYHTRLLEKNIGIEKGYRCTHVDEFKMGNDGTIGLIEQTADDRHQITAMNPYEDINACTFTLVAGANPLPADEESKKYGCGNMMLSGITDGAFTKVQGLDFGNEGASSVSVTIRSHGNTGTIRISEANPDGNVLCYIPINSSEEETSDITVKLDKALTKKHDICFTFSGTGYDVLSWKFKK